MHNFSAEMKRIAEEGKKAGHSFDVIRIELKEYLQNFVLDFIYNSEFKSLMFYGGSCLRILYGLERMSEDLDFEAKEGLNFELLKSGLERYFESDIQLKKVKISLNKDGDIMRIFLVFPIMSEIGLSKHASETLQIKLEIRSVSDAYVDAIYKNIMHTPITKYGKVFVVRHYDLPTLMATKMAAILQKSDKGFRVGRPEDAIDFKGRYFYDLIWFMQQRVLPNEEVLKMIGATKSIDKIFGEIAISTTKINVEGIRRDLKNLFLRIEFADNFAATFRETFANLWKAFYRPKTGLKLREIYIDQDYDSGRYMFLFRFASNEMEDVAFRFNLAESFIKYPEFALSMKEAEVDEQFKRFIMYGKRIKEDKKDRLNDYAAVFYRKIKNYKARHENQICFSKWESKLIRMSQENHNPLKEIIVLPGMLALFASSEYKLENLAM